MTKKECIGWVWLKDQQRPIVEITPVAGRKNLYIITLGNGLKKRIKANAIIRLEEKCKTS